MDLLLGALDHHHGVYRIRGIDEFNDPLQIFHELAKEPIRHVRAADQSDPDKGALADEMRQRFGFVASGIGGGLERGDRVDRTDPVVFVGFGIVPMRAASGAMFDHRHAVARHEHHHGTVGTDRLVDEPPDIARHVIFIAEGHQRIDPSILCRRAKQGVAPADLGRRHMGEAGPCHQTAPSRHLPLQPSTTAGLQTN